LRTEERSLDQHYIDYIGNIADEKFRQDTTSLVDIDTVLKLDDRWNSEKDKIQERRQLGEDYIKLLQQIVSSHQNLASIYNNGQKPSQKQVSEMTQKNIKALEKFIKTAEKVSAQDQK